MTIDIGDDNEDLPMEPRMTTVIIALHKFTVGMILVEIFMSNDKWRSSLRSSLLGSRFAAPGPGGLCGPGF